MPKNPSLVIAFALSAAGGFAAAKAGRVVNSAGQPVAHVSVIDKETLEGARTDDSGNFSLELPDQGPVTLVVTLPGGQSVERVLNDLTEPLELQVSAPATDQVEMAPVSVHAGAYPTGNAPGAALTALEVVTTPGATADINRALQTLPGVQNVDEGNALYVRGGDYWETGTFVNNAFYPSAIRLEAPTGTFVGTVNPFLTQSISFNSGGFGARYGNLLSGLVALETQDTPLVPEGTVNLGLGAASFGGALPVGHDFGLRASATRLDLGPVIRLNSSTQDFAPAPRGHDLSGSAMWEYRPGAEIKFFAIEQENDFGVRIDRPSFSGVYAEGHTNRLGVLSWKNTFDQWSIEASLSASESQFSEKFGPLGVDSTVFSERLFAEARFTVSDRLSLAGGLEAEHTHSDTAGQKPDSFDLFQPDALSENVGAILSGERESVFLETDWLITPALRAVVGGRIDRSTFTEATSFDPRTSLAYRWAKGVYLTAATGVYHQVADPTFYNPTLDGSDLPAMRATHEILGLQLGEKQSQVRIEVYDKAYSDLAQLTRDRLVARGGRGRSRGLDLFGRTTLPGGIRARVTVSLLDAVRTDPDSGEIARAPFGIRNSTTLILQRNLPFGIEAGASWKIATGKPFTEIVGANYDASQHAYLPIYGAPEAGRLPSYQRLDLSFSKLTQVHAHYLTVLYVSLSNVLGRKNVYDYTYTYDYRSRQAIPSLFNRSVYFGVSLIYR